MDVNFPEILSRLRKDSGINQRTAASHLKISQALLSHYENGLREPGLDFVVRACRYYNVSSDYLLGMSSIRNGFNLSLPDSEQSEQLSLVVEAASSLLACSDALERRTQNYLALALYRLYCVNSTECGKSASFEELQSAVALLELEMTRRPPLGTEPSGDFIAHIESILRLILPVS